MRRPDIFREVRYRKRSKTAHTGAQRVMRLIINSNVEWSLRDAPTSRRRDRVAIGSTSATVSCAEPRHSQMSIGEHIRTPIKYDSPTHSLTMSVHTVRCPAETGDAMTNTRQAPHYCVSIARFIEDNPSRAKRYRLRVSHVAFLHLAWGCCRNPFAVQPTVTLSYSYIAMMLGTSNNYVGRLTRELAHAGCLKKGQSRKGRGTPYTLLRPKYSAEDLELSPFQPSSTENVAKAAAEMLRADGRTMKPEKKKCEQPAILPSEIAQVLEDMAGWEPHTIPHKTKKGVKIRKPVLPFSAKCGDCSAVKAAQGFIQSIVDKGASLGAAFQVFQIVCAAAAKRPAFAPTKEERARLFENAELVEELRAEVRSARAAMTAEPAVSS